MSSAGRAHHRGGVALDDHRIGLHLLEDLVDAADHLGHDPVQALPSAHDVQIMQGEDVEQRSEEHTSELQSRFELVCRLLLEKKKTEQVNHEDVYTIQR